MLNMQVPCLFSLLYLIILYENLLLKRKQQQQISFVKNITSICHFPSVQMLTVAEVYKMMYADLIKHINTLFFTG